MPQYPALFRFCRAAALSVAALCAAQLAHAKDRALLVGVSDYQDPSVPDLRGAPVNDVRAFSAFVRGSMGIAPSDVMILTDAAATKSAVLDAIDRWLIAGTNPGDRVVFYFSGHGFQQPDADGDENADGLDETIVPHDARRLETAAGVRIDRMISDDELSERFSKLANRKVWVVVDSCHSGTVLRGGGGTGASAGFSKFPFGLPLPIPNLKTTSGSKTAPLRDADYTVSDGGEINVWYAVAPDELAQVDQRDAVNPISLFTGSLLKGLRNLSADANKDGVVTNAELLAYVRAESSNYYAACVQFPKAPCQTTMTPLLQSEAKDLLLRPAFERAAPSSNNLVAKPGVAKPTNSPVKPTPKPSASSDSKPTAAASTFSRQQLTGALPSTASSAVTLALPNRGQLKIGDLVTYGIDFKTQGQLILLDLGPDGAMRQIFPNTVSDTTSKQRVFTGLKTIPTASDTFVFRASAPAGEGIALALWIEPDVDLIEVTRQIDFAAIRSPAEHIAALAHKLNGLIKEGGTVRPIRWAADEVTYRVR